MRLRLLALAAAAGIGVTALPSHAATAPKPQITDPAGDANGINDQGEPAAVPSQSTPGDVSGADIKSVTFATTFVTKRVHGKSVRTATGFTVTMALSAAPMPFVNYRVYASTSACASLFFEYNTTPGTAGPRVRCPGSIPAVSADKLFTATETVKGSSIVWTVPTKTFPAGTSFSTLKADTRFNPVKLTVPVIDEASTAATFTVGQ
jgi:hypothetical protein